MTVDLDVVGEGPCIKVLADLAQVFTMGIEFQDLRRGGAIGGTVGVAAVEDENMPFGIYCHARSFAQIHVGGNWSGFGTESKAMLGTSDCAPAPAANIDTPARASVPNSHFFIVNPPMCLLQAMTIFGPYSRHRHGLQGEVQLENQIFWGRCAAAYRVRLHRAWPDGYIHLIPGASRIVMICCA